MHGATALKVLRLAFGGPHTIISISWLLDAGQVHFRMCPAEQAKLKCRFYCVERVSLEYDIRAIIVAFLKLMRCRVMLHDATNPFHLALRAR